MVDVNLFSSKTDIKKLLFTTEKFHLNDHLSNDSWQDLSELTPTHDADYSTIDKRDIRSRPRPTTDYSRLDRWIRSNQTNKNEISSQNKRLSNATSIHPATEHTFPDSCESLTVSVDLHVPTEELITDHNEFDEENLVVWRKKIQDYRNRITSTETLRSSR